LTALTSRVDARKLRERPRRGGFAGPDRDAALRLGHRACAAFREDAMDQVGQEEVDALTRVIQSRLDA